MSNSGEGVTRHSRDAHCARVMHRSRPHQEEGTGNAGAANAPAALRAVKKARKQVTTGTPKRRHSLRNGLTAYTCSPWCTGLFSHHRPAIRLAELDPSVGRSGPHDFAVRIGHARLARQHAHRIPRPTSVTIASRPSCERETRRLGPLICPTRQGRQVRQINTTGKTCMAVMLICLSCKSARTSPHVQVRFGRATVADTGGSRQVLALLGAHRLQDGCRAPP